MSGAEVRTSNGVTTYTPRPSTGANYTPSARPAPASNSFTPRTPSPSSPAVASVHTSHPVYSIPAPATGGRSGAENSKLTAEGSQSVLHQVNTARGGLTGVNQRSIPPGQVAVHPNGRLTVTAANGRNFDVRPNGTLASVSAHGQVAIFRGDGRLASVHTPTMDIARGPLGHRMVISERPGGGRLVSVGARNGYYEHPVAYNGHNYVQRSYLHDGHSFTRSYAQYQYHGATRSNYVPAATYAPAFYGWAYYPWENAAAYMWGWASSSWFACNSGYFDPSGAYQSGANWLTDYYLGQTLANAYDAGAQAGSCPGGGGPVSGSQTADTTSANAQAQIIDFDQAGGDEAYAPADTPITPEIKQMIAEEVKQQLAFENAAAARPNDAPMLDGLPQVMVAGHLFVVGLSLNVSSTEGQLCGLSAGDVIKLAAVPPDGDVTADLTVVSSRKADCPAGLTVVLPLDDLQEMQNNFRAQLDSGLKTLRDQQGQNGLPVAPQSAITPPPMPVDQPPAESEDVQSMLDEQRQQADQAESSVTEMAFNNQQ